MTTVLDLGTAVAPGAVVLQGNALSLDLPDSCVDLIVTSPPYFALRNYRDNDATYAGQVGAEATPFEFLDALWLATAEMIRVLKPSGSLWVNLGDKYSASGGHNNSGLCGLTGSNSIMRQRSPKQVAAQDAMPRCGPGISAGASAKSTLDGGMRKLRELDADSRDGPKRYTQGNNGIPAKSLMGLPWRYAIGCVDRLGLVLRAEVVWSKLNGMPESVTDRVRRSHETWFHFTKKGRYFAGLDSIREPQRLPGSVWTLPTEPLRVPAELGVEHFAAFPTALPARIISGWSPANGVVLDPFGGTGTTAAVALALGRYGISVDLSADYCRLASWRIFESGHGERGVQRAIDKGFIRAVHLAVTPSGKSHPPKRRKRQPWEQQSLL